MPKQNGARAFRDEGGSSLWMRAREWFFVLHYTCHQTSAFLQWPKHAGGECHGFVFRLLHLLCTYLAAVATTVIVTLTVILDENFSNCIGQFCFMAD